MPHTEIHRLLAYDATGTDELVVVEVREGKGRAPSGVQLCFRGGHPMIALLPQSKWTDAAENEEEFTPRFHVDGYPLPPYPLVGVTLDTESLQKVIDWLSAAKERLAGAK